MRNFAHPRAHSLSSKIAYVTWKKKSDYLNSRTQASLRHSSNNSRLAQGRLRAAHPVLVLPQDPKPEVSPHSRRGHRPLLPARLPMPILQDLVRRVAS